MTSKSRSDRSKVELGTGCDKRKNATEKCQLCDTSKSYDTCILVDFEKYLGLGGPAGCSVCIHVRTLSRGGHRSKKGGMVSEKLHREGIALSASSFRMPQKTCSSEVSGLLMLSADSTKI